MAEAAAELFPFLLGKKHQKHKKLNIYHTKKSIYRMGFWILYKCEKNHEFWKIIEFIQ